MIKRKLIVVRNWQALALTILVTMEFVLVCSYAVN